MNVVNIGKVSMNGTGGVPEVVYGSLSLEMTKWVWPDGTNHFSELAIAAKGEIYPFYGIQAKQGLRAYFGTTAHGGWVYGDLDYLLSNRDFLTVHPSSAIGGVSDLFAQTVSYFVGFPDWNPR